MEITKWCAKYIENKDLILHEFNVDWWDFLIGGLIFI